MREDSISSQVRKQAQESFSGSSSLAISLSTGTRFFIPSVGDIFFIALLGVLIFTPLSVRLLGDAGIGWHIRTGQQILATHEIPRVDSFSSTMAGKPWFAWEWLYDLAVGTIERATGLNGVVLLSALAIACVFAGVLRLLVRRGVNVLLALTLTMLAVSASMIHFLARPHVMSWLFTLIWFEVLDSSEQDSLAGQRSARGRMLWLLPLLMIVWANVHGGFLIAFPLLAIYWVSAVWTRWQCKEDVLEELLRKLRMARLVRDLSVVGVLSALATLANPYGWKLHAHIYRYLSDRFLMNHIEEFQSPNFHGVAERCFTVLLLIALISLAASKRRGLRVSEGLVVLFAAYSGLYASRNIPVAAILLVLICGPMLSEVLGRLRHRLPESAWFIGRRTDRIGFVQRVSAIEVRLRGHLWPVAAAVVATWIAFHDGQLGSRQVMNAHFDGHRFPVAAVDYLKANHVAGSVLAPDYWGGYLIYSWYPQVRVVVDDRHDFYGAEFFKSYLNMIHVDKEWYGFIREHPAACLLVPKTSALANIMLLNHNWRTVYADDVAIAFEPVLGEQVH